MNFKIYAFIWLEIIQKFCTKFYKKIQLFSRLSICYFGNGASGSKNSNIKYTFVLGEFLWTSTGLPLYCPLPWYSVKWPEKRWQYQFASLEPSWDQLTKIFLIKYTGRTCIRIALHLEQQEPSSVLKSAISQT